MKTDGREKLTGSLDRADGEEDAQQCGPGGGYQGEGGGGRTGYEERA